MKGVKPEIVMPALMAGTNLRFDPFPVAPEPPEFISEVIPVKYSRASEVAAALLRMVTNNVRAGQLLASGTPENPPGNTRTNGRNDSSLRLRNLIRKAATIGESQALECC
ncbi:MAG: hypothetical protein NT154_01655 [Verrucomicrobia bacterium]|nr:hypothetical protein [Verrucomicrobiota bacterium]